MRTAARQLLRQKWADFFRVSITCEKKIQINYSVQHAAEKHYLPHVGTSQCSHLTPGSIV